MIYKGKTYHPYFLIRHHDLIPFPVYDSRPLAEVTKAWLEATAKAAERGAEHEKIVVGVNLKNSALHNKTHGEFVQDVDFRDAVGAPAFSVKEDELLIMTGIPGRDGYGGFVMVACDIQGIVYADHKNKAGLLGALRRGKKRRLPAVVRGRRAAK